MHCRRADSLFLLLLLLFVVDMPDVYKGYAVMLLLWNRRYFHGSSCGSLLIGSGGTCSLPAATSSK